jgi:hypothetical protein
MSASEGETAENLRFLPTQGLYFRTESVQDRGAAAIPSLRAVYEEAKKIKNLATWRCTQPNRSSDRVIMTYLIPGRRWGSAVPAVLYVR